MAEFVTKHDIGDLVYTADVSGVDRDVIKAIKVTGLNKKIYYGIESKQPGYWSMFMGSNDKYYWYDVTQVFTTKEDADNLHSLLKAKCDAKEEKDAAVKKAKRLAELKREQQALESGEDYTEDDYDD